MNSLKNIFLVEDDLDDQLFFAEALGKIKNAALYYIASNGREALDKLETAAVLPDIIFMDVHMPKMDGIECLTAITKNEKIKNIPVVMLTTDTGKMKLVHELGAKAFIKKPSDGKILHQKIEQMINLDFSADSHIASQTFQPVIALA
ncbi:MAG TPA: response regulator [Bacteroidia bacterium]|nr:response regulator [Bacteroidia bacterium]